MNDEANNEGRPLKFSNVEDLNSAIEQYFNSREPHIVKSKIKTTKADGSFYWAEDELLSPALPKTMTGLARALKVDRKTLLNYKNRDEFFPSIANALAICEEYAEEQLFIGRNSNGAAFVLKNNYAWSDKRQVETYTHDIDEVLDNLEKQKAEMANKAQDELELITA